MWPIKEKENRQLLIKSYSLEQAVRMHRYGSLIKLNPSGSHFNIVRKHFPTKTRREL